MERLIYTCGQCDKVQLAVAQREGISVERAIALVEPLLHRH